MESMADAKEWISDLSQADSNLKDRIMLSVSYYYSEHIRALISGKWSTYNRGRTNLILSCQKEISRAVNSIQTLQGEQKFLE